MPNIRPGVPDSTLVTVYEAVNEPLRELYVGASMYLMGQIADRLQRVKELSHWRRQDRVSVRAVEFSMPLRDALDFVRRYEIAKANAGWNVISANHLPDIDVDASSGKRAQSH